MVKSTMAGMVVMLVLASVCPGGVRAAQAAGPAAASNDYIVACTQQLNIRTGPSTESLVIAKAEKGDLFLHAGETADWFEIVLFSGDTRYVSRTYAARLTPAQILPGHRLELPASREERASLRASLAHAMRRAEREAQEVLPESVDPERHANLKHILQDQHILHVLHLYGVHAALYPDLLAEGGKR